MGTTVRKNLFRSSYHVAILYSGNDHLIELNEFHHVVSITFDSGAIYAGRDLTSRGTVRVCCFTLFLFPLVLV